jgi:dihydrofolate reductase
LESALSKLIMWNLVTLDGFFEGGAPWDLDFHRSVFDNDLERYSIEQLQTADMLLFGRVTYEGMAAHWQGATGEVADFMNRLPKAVVSTTLPHAEWQNTRVISENVAATIRELKAVGERNIYVFGSGALTATLMNEGLFDEYRLAIVPVVLGEGKPLFPMVPNAMELTLIESRTMASGCVILCYQPQRGAPL